MSAEEEWFTGKHHAISNDGVPSLRPQRSATTGHFPWLWHNFGDETRVETSRQMLLHAFDLGITHFDLANNYGPPPGSAESNFGRILKESLLPYRDELIISTKAGYTMWDGPYGDWGSRNIW
ncbi:ion-channel protein [Klebsiella pneumoniae]|uniref:Ion-channel protein n=2 Tax=Klebsiella pneumoniae TaxID=573 RepID=A0A377XGK9_KLEPN|nr:ion-channel protein [Klebsiella pneumoniae]